MAYRSVIPSGKNRNDMPLLRDLYRYIVGQQAAQWEWLGLELGLNNGQISIISRDYRNDVEACCRKMLSKWLEMDPSATWGKLDDAIKNMMLPSTTSPVSPNKEDQEPVLIVSEGFEEKKQEKIKDDKDQESILIVNEGFKERQRSEISLATTGTSSVKMQSSLSQVKLFITYAWEEATNDFVLKLKEDLEATGLQIFLDKHELLPGDIIQREVAKGIEEADGIIVVYSERYPDSKWCHKELQMAQNRNKKIFPVRRIKGQYDRNAELAFGDIVYANFILNNEETYKSSLDLLIMGIEKNCVKKR